jgi:hypothetical protein
MIASAVLLDALTEVHAKFVKVADKECEGLSTEVKKWFKKLAVSRRLVAFSTFSS